MVELIIVGGVLAALTIGGLVEPLIDMMCVKFGVYDKSPLTWEE